MGGDRVWLSGWRPYALLAALCFALYLPGIAAIPPLDRDEERFAQASRQMLETGDFLRIRFQDQARNKKPTGIYWLQAASVAAILLKGRVGPAIAALTLITLSVADRDWRWLRGLYPVAGVIFVALAIVPWIVAMERATEGAFLAGSLGEDFWSKLIGAQESHGAPPLAYLLSAIATFWPGSLLLVPALAHAWRRRMLPAERFLVAWLVPAWIVLELLPTKLPHYVLPLYPALALLTGAALAEGARAAAPTWLRYTDIAAKGPWAAAPLWSAPATMRCSDSRLAGAV